MYLLKAYIVLRVEILFIGMFGPSVNCIVIMFDIKQPCLVRADKSCLPTNDGVEFLGSTECNFFSELSPVYGPGLICADAGIFAF